VASGLWYRNGADSLMGLYNELFAVGEEVAPRGQRTLEMRNVTIVIDDPTDVLMTGMGRKMNTGLAAAEALQLIAGISDAALMERIAPNTVAFQDGGYFHGAYGPRLRGQIPAVLQRLGQDRSTRQAVAMVWDPMHDLYVHGMHDYPCTIYISWAIRNSKLEQTTHMRSNDLWWGWTYDLVQFTMLQNTMAQQLGLLTGSYTHYVDSFHFYMRDQDALEAVHPRSDLHDVQRLDGLPMCGTWDRMQMQAERILHSPHSFVNDEDETVAWLATALVRRG
jgi:hypothetical protein